MSNARCCLEWAQPAGSSHLSIVPWLWIRRLFFISSLCAACFLSVIYCALPLNAEIVMPGVNVFFEKKQAESLKGKRIGLITNHTGVDWKLRPTVQLFLDRPELQLVALFCPEHGFEGQAHAAEEVKDGTWAHLPIHSLYGATRRPTESMLQDIDVLIYDIQCVGTRSYTYPTTLFYAMEEAAKRNIEVVVLDRPNPINGTTIDGPMLEEKWRSYISYINVPYCHGMTIGELARLFNAEYKIGCKLTVIPMRGWRRSMTYRDTGLTWIPPSPNIPEADTPFFYPSGILGELKMLNIGIGYTLPFKIVGAPWINAKEYATKLNAQNLPGVHFLPFYFKPFYGLYKGQNCQGILIRVTDPRRYLPIAVQYLVLGVLKSLYPKIFAERLAQFLPEKTLFHQANGTDAIYRILKEEKYATWKLLEFHHAEREAFREKRKKYLLPEYLD